MNFVGFPGTLGLLIRSGVDFHVQTPADAMLFISMMAIHTIGFPLTKIN